MQTSWVSFLTCLAYLSMSTFARPMSFIEATPAEIILYDDILLVLIRLVIE